jgi:hypothetical protein
VWKYETPESFLLFTKQYHFKNKFSFTIVNRFFYILAPCPLSLTHSLTHSLQDCLVEREKIFPNNRIEMESPLTVHVCSRVLNVGCGVLYSFIKVKYSPRSPKSVLMKLNDKKKLFLF